MSVAKSHLFLAHGNADIERGFSDSRKSSTPERTALSEKSINGLLSTTDGIKTWKRTLCYSNQQALFTERTKCTHELHAKTRGRKDKKGNGKGKTDTGTTTEKRI